MTLYSYKINFTSGEIPMLRTALKNMIDYCQEELDKGKTAPFYIHKKNAPALLDKISYNVQRTRGNSSINCTTGEVKMLRMALKNMIDHCQEELDKGGTAPFYAHKKNAQAVLDKLHSDIQQISGNNFGPDLDFLKGE